MLSGPSTYELCLLPYFFTTSSLGNELSINNTEKAQLVVSREREWSLRNGVQKGVGRYSRAVLLNSLCVAAIEKRNLLLAV